MEKFPCHIILCFYTIFCSLDPLAWIVNLFTGSMVFLVNWKISFMNSRDKPVLTESVLILTETILAVTNFCRFRYLVDFDVKIVLLGQNSFEWIAFYWVVCILNLYWNFKIFCHCHLLLIFQFYSIELFVKS